MTNKLIHQKEGWELQPEICAFDPELCDIAHIEDWKDLTVFHMGPGLHHEVGRHLSERNRVISITCSIEEMAAYVQFVIDNPEKSGNYQCMFGDIYKLEPYFFGKFDVISLPHIGEMPDEARLEYGAKNDNDLLSMFIAMMLNFNGKIIFYKGSSAWDRIKPIVSQNKRLKIFMVSENIVVYKKA